MKNGMIEYEGAKEWWKNDKFHRENGPAIERPNGTKEWWKNGHLHRENGPAVEYADGGKEWFINGHLHRENGPAIEYADRTRIWYINGLTQRKKRKKMMKNISFKKECIAFSLNEDDICNHFNNRTCKCNYFLYDVECEDYTNEKENRIKLS